ncbi:MAG: hypothetical protein ACFFDQ_01245 [Candidatus Thorarchaeota archaeon]
MADSDNIIEHLVNQFDSSWKLLREAIKYVPNDKWTMGIEPIKKSWAESKGRNIWYFSERVYHIIQTVEFYCADDPKSMKWGSRIGGIERKKESPEETAVRIKKEDMLEYLDEIKEKLELKLRSFSSDDLFTTDGFSEWQPSRLAKFLYTMRHSMWHIGELSKALRDWDGERVNWQ